jgi:hypothetical protein
MLSLVIAYGERGRDGRALALSLHVVIAAAASRTAQIASSESRHGKFRRAH